MSAVRRCVVRAWAARFGAVSALLAGCASTPSEAAETASGASSGAEAAPVEPVLSEVSWELFERLRIDGDGNLHRGHTFVGRFGVNGDFVGEDGGIVRLEPDGTLLLDGERTHFRIVDGVVFERTTAVMRIEQSVLIVGSQSEEEERVTLEGFHPARTREVLMSSTLMLIGMAAAFAH